MLHPIFLSHLPQQAHPLTLSPFLTSFHNFFFRLMASSSSSTVIACIDSALRAVDYRTPSDYFWREDAVPRKQRFSLRNLKTFVILTGKFGKDVHLRYYDNKNEDGSLGSLLTRIEDAVTRYSRISPFVNLLEDFDTQREQYSHGIEMTAYGFQRVMRSFKEEIDEWYIAMSDDTRQSNYLTADEVGEITDSILENLVDVYCFSGILGEQMEALREHVNFLKNFCRFATRRGVKDGQMKDFLAHTEAVAITAARLCFLCASEPGGEGWRQRLQFKISMLLQKIKPIDLQVCETYTQVMRCSKLSTRLDTSTHIQEMEDDSTIVMKNFVDSLISILWEMLKLDTRHVVSWKDNWQVLYEGLRSLRTILKKMQPNDINGRTWDDIGVMVCDAGVLVCFFYQRNVEMDIGLQDLLEKIKILGAEVGEKVPQTSIFSPSSINQPGFVDFLLENLMGLTNDNVEPIAKNHVQTIKEELLYLRAFLGEIVELRYEQEEIQALWNRVLEVAHRVEFLIDHLTVGGISDSFSMQFDSVMEDIQKIKADALKISNGKRQDIKVKEVTSTSSHVPSQATASTTSELVGFHNEAKSLMDRLQRGPEQLRVVAIVGMGGLGKTTLAAKVYDHPAVMLYFHVRARCTVSQTLDKRRLLLEILNQIDPGKYSEKKEEDLAEELRKHLKGKRYLIFLDDVWTSEAWNSLQGSFPDDSKGSRIILTSRNHDAAPLAMLDQECLYLRQLNTEESLELLQRKLFPGEVWPPALYDLGMQIVENCKGLPLTIVIVAGLLATTEQEGWKEIVDGLSAGIVFSSEQCMSTLELSYKHLPDHLKSCFLYFGAFPEDQEIYVRRLIRLWIAEGFVQKGEWKSLHDAAEAYLKDLIGRSLIMVAKRSSTGGVKACRIHDLLRDFCLRKAKDEHFLHLVKGYDELLAFSEPCNLRRLCIHSEPDHYKQSKVFCPRARSLLFFPSQRSYSYRKDASINIFLVHIFKFVIVLDLEDINLGSVFPSEIEHLVQLRYLAIRGRIAVIPSWVGNLSMLETFIVCGVKVSLPDTIWNLTKLKYLYIRSNGNFGGGVLPVENLDNSVLFELDTLCGAIFICRGSTENPMRNFPNIRRLKLMLLPSSDDAEFQNIVVLDFLSRLESLNMAWHEESWDYNISLDEMRRIEFCFPTNLKKLTLSGFGLPWSKISTIGKLPNLEVLKLLRESFTGKTWEMEEGEFRKLRYLKLDGLYLVRWTASDSDDHLPCLEKLELVTCKYLEEMPCCLESTQTLEMIEVRYCSEATSSLVKHIEEEQMRVGNVCLRVLLN